MPGYENGNMPAYDGQLDETQVAGVAAYIRELSGAATAADTPVPSAHGAASDSTATQ